jgi:hypothetical protein
MLAFPAFAAETGDLLLHDNSPWAYQYVVAVNSPTLFIPKEEPTDDGWCVSYVRAHGYEQYTGDAKDWANYINSDEPTIGGVVVLDEGPLDHLALITAVSSASLDLIEQNFEGLGIVSTRSLDRSSEDIIGFIKK